MTKTCTLIIELLENGRIGVSFPYNEEIISRLRGLTDRKWDPDKRRWNVGLCHLNELKDIFCLETSKLDKRLIRAYQMYRIRDGRAKINVGIVDAIISGVNLPIDKIDRSTSFHLPGYRFITRFKKGSWDGKRHLFSVKKQVFPSGLALHVARIVRDAGVDCDITWPEEPETCRLIFPEEITQRAKPKTGKSPAGQTTSKTIPKKAKRPAIKLRQYQIECLQCALKEQRGIIEIATGGGKTLIAANIIRQIARPALFLVHTRDLMYQTVEVLRQELGIPIGFAGDGKIELQSVTVATIQTCARAMDIKLDKSPDDDEILEKDRPVTGDTGADLQQFIRTTPVVFFDECHHLPADTTYGLAMEMHAALWRYGLSATPYRADRQDLLMEAALGPKIFSARASALIDQGFLVPPKIQFLPVPPLIVRSGKMNYQEIYTAYVIENKHRNRLIADTAQQIADEGKSVLILVSQVRHGEVLQKLLGDIPLVQGTDDAAERHKIFDALGKKKKKIVVATTLADEGLDVPSLDSVILASAGRSETRALQRVGRTLRTSLGKTEAIVIDFMDNAPYLREHATERLELFRSEPRFEVKF